MIPIAILGAGPSGLMLGRLLENAYIDYIIFERDESANLSGGQGGTLDLHVGTGQLALQEGGLFEKFKKLARYDGSNRIANYQGEIVADLGAGSDNTRPEIDRKDLRAMLLESIPAERIKWGKRVQQVTREPSGTVSIHFEDGSVENKFRLVVGADGAWSKVRHLVTSAKPVYSGYHYITSHLQEGNPHYNTAVTLAGQGNYMAFGNGQQLSAMKLGDGSYHTGLGLRLPETWSKDTPLPARHKLMLEYCSGWPALQRGMITNPDDDFRAWPLYSMPTHCFSWKPVPGVTLIGDAAHVSTPFAGEGVNCSMFDSYQLAQKISKYGIDRLDQAVAEYEQNMFPRAVELISDSARHGEMLFGPDGPKPFLEQIGL